MKTIPTLTHATERDIDLLLVEEFACSPTFASWFFSHTGGQAIHSNSLKSKPRLFTREHNTPHQILNTEVLHSVRRMHNRREIDLSVVLTFAEGKVLLLLENKLDTDEQPYQAESYREEAQTLASKYFQVYIGLICPKAYAAKKQIFAEKFDFLVTYEMIIGHFETRSQNETGELTARFQHRASLMHQAVEKERRGYTQVIHPAKRRFSKQYVDLLKKIAPNLIPGPSMLRESAAESVTMIFAPTTLLKWSFLPQTRIVHQLREGNANINFYGWGDHFTELAQPMASSLAGTGFKLVPTQNKRKGGRSGLMVIANTPRIDQFSEFDNQRDAIIEGMQQVDALRKWFIDSKHEIKNWARIVAKAG